MIFIYGIHLQKDDIAMFFLHFFPNFKGQQWGKRAKNGPED